MEQINKETIAALVSEADRMLERAYVPYSRFRVGAALLCDDGSIYSGCNIENASYPAGSCAERTAISKAVSEGKTSFLCIVIVGGKEGIKSDICPPCGVCRQFMREFVDPHSFKVILAKTGTDYKEFLLEDLLPLSFGPDQLD